MCRMRNRSDARRSVFRLFVAVVCLFVTLSHVHAQEPIAIQRIVLPPERVAAEMDRVKRQVLTVLPREEFEALVRSATAASEPGRDAPKLIRTNYSATLSGDGLIGTAEW